MTPWALPLKSKWTGQPHTSDEYRDFVNELRAPSVFDFFLLAGCRISEGIEAARNQFSSLRRAARAAVKDEHEQDDFHDARQSADDDDHKSNSSALDARMARRIAREQVIARQGTSVVEEDDDDAHSSIGINDFEATDISSMLQDDSKCEGDLSLLMALLRPKALSQLLGHKWNDPATYGNPGDAQVEKLLNREFDNALLTLNITYVSAIRNHLFPGGQAVSDRVRLLQGDFFNESIRNLLTRNCSTTKWRDAPWTMPAVVVTTALHSLAHSLQHASTSSLLNSMSDIISTATNAGSHTSPMEFDTKVVDMLCQYRKYKSVDELCNHIHCCLRVEVIKKLKSLPGPPGEAYTQAWQACLDIRNRNQRFTATNTLAAMRTAQNHIIWENESSSSDSGGTSTTTKKTFVAAAAGGPPVFSSPTLEPKVGVDLPAPPGAPTGALPGQVSRACAAWYGSFVSGDVSSADALQRASQAFYGVFKDGGKGGTGGTADKDKGSSRGRSQSRSRGGYKGPPCTTPDCPAPHTHSTARCVKNASEVMAASQAREERKAAQQAKKAMLSAHFVNKVGSEPVPSYFPLPSCVVPCLPPIDEHLCPPARSHSALSAEQALPTRPPSDSAVVDTGADVNVTNKASRCQSTPTQRVPLVGVGGSQPAWVASCSWYTRTDNGRIHRLQLPRTRGIHELYVPDSPEELLSLAVLHEAGYTSSFNPGRSWLCTPQGDRITLMFHNRL